MQWWTPKHQTSAQVSQLRRGPPGSLGLHVQRGTPGSPWQGLYRAPRSCPGHPVPLPGARGPCGTPSLWWPRLPAFKRPDAAVPEPCSLRSQSSRTWRVDRLLGFHPVSQGSTPLWRIRPLCFARALCTVVRELRDCSSGLGIRLCQQRHEDTREQEIVMCPQLQAAL